MTNPALNASPPPLPPYPSGDLEHLPGSDGPPLVGHTLDFLRDTVTLVRRQAERHGPVFRMKTFGYRQLVVGDADAARAILMDSEGNFSSAMGWNAPIGRLFARGLMLRDFEDHRAHRLIMQGAFRNEAMRNYLSMMNPAMEQAMAAWPVGESFRFYPAIKRLTLDLAAEVFLGLPLGAEADDLNRSFTAAVAASIAVVKREVPGLSFRRGMKGRRHLAAFFRDLVPRRRQRGGRDMLTQLCQAEAEDGSRFDDEEIVDHMIFLMMAAHDTTTSTLASILWALTRDLEWQERLRGEALSVERDWMELDERDRLCEMDWVMKEAMRCHPPVPFIPRRVLRDCELGGYPIPANTGVSVCSLLLHRDETYWTDPDAFDPLRFSPQRGEDKGHSHCYVPFGGGAHTCIGLHFAGLQIKAFLVQLLRRYRVRLEAGHEVEFVPIPIPWPKRGLPIVLERVG